MTATSPRRALITGGASGFGLEVARKLRAISARVALLDRDAAKLDDAATELGETTVSLPCDVRDVKAVQAAVEAAALAMGGIDTLVLSAGVIHIKSLDEVTEEDWDLTLDVNLKGAFLTAQATAPYLTSTDNGRIVAISSDAGRRGFAWIQAYTSSKFGLIGLIESLAVELAPAGTTVNCICPVGCPTTGMGQEVLDWKVRRAGITPQEIVETTARNNPVGRNATADDVANAVMFFLSDEASFLTGVSLDVDGGAHLGFFPGAE